MPPLLIAFVGKYLKLPDSYKSMMKVRLAFLIARFARLENLVEQNVRRCGTRRCVSVSFDTAQKQTKQIRMFDEFAINRLFDTAGVRLETMLIDSMLLETPDDGTSAAALDVVRRFAFADRA